MSILNIFAAKAAKTDAPTAPPDLGEWPGDAGTSAASEAPAAASPDVLSASPTAAIQAAVMAAAAPPAPESPRTLSIHSDIAPETYAECLQLRREWAQLPHSTTKENQHKHARQVWLAEQARTIEHGPRVDHDAISLNSARAMINRSHDGPKHRAARLAKLKECLENPRPWAISFPNLQGRNSLKIGAKDLLLSSTEIQTKVCTARLCLVHHEIFKTEHFAFLNPTMRAEEIRHEINSCTDIKALGCLKMELAAISGPDGHLGRQNARVAVDNDYQPAKESLQELLDSSKRITGEMLADAKKLEADFLNQFGFKWSSTPISQKFQQLQDQLNRLQPSDQLLVWFGLPDLLAKAPQILETPKPDPTEAPNPVKAEKPLKKALVVLAITALALLFAPSVQAQRAGVVAMSLPTNAVPVTAGATNAVDLSGLNLVPNVSGLQYSGPILGCWEYEYVGISITPTMAGAATGTVTFRIALSWDGAKTFETTPSLFVTVTFAGTTNANGSTLLPIGAATHIAIVSVENSTGADMSSVAIRGNLKSPKYGAKAATQ